MSEYLTIEQRETLVNQCEEILSLPTVFNSSACGKLAYRDDLNWAVVQIFESYIQDYENIILNVEGVHKKKLTLENFNFKMTNRWTHVYKRRTLAKFYKLEKWYDSEGRPPVTMMTLTSKQSDFNIADQMRFINDGRNKLFDVIRHDYPKIQYVYVAEPHKSGYMHFHVLFFRRFTDADKKRYREMWVNKFKIGGYKSALSFSRVTREIKSVKNYLMKYLEKTFSDVSSKMKSAGEWLFNAYVHYVSRRDTKGSGVRFYNTSRQIASAIKLDPNEKVLLVKRVTMISFGDESVIYVNENFDSELMDIINKSEMLLKGS